MYAVHIWKVRNISFPVSHRLASSTRTALLHNKIGSWESTSLEIYRSVYHGRFSSYLMDILLAFDTMDHSLPPFLNGLLGDSGLPPPALCLGFSLVCWFLWEVLQCWPQAPPPPSTPAPLLPVFSVSANLSVPFASVAPYLQMISTSSLQLWPPLGSRSIYPVVNGHLLGVSKASQV